ncbi:uncharacterized protein LOC142898346 [Nelusetta ayraudi]|uniref:uncharacterized protein LOC142898346 n=1 Tax=Nelusetta ayraudi TaxID=303726 RepID=UPI003F6F911C
MWQFEGEDLLQDDPDIMDFLMGLEDVFTEEAGPLRVEVTPASEERSQEVTPANVQLSKEILSLLMDGSNLPKSTATQEPRLSPPGPPAPTPEPPCTTSPVEPAAKKQKKDEAAAGEEKPSRRRRRRQLVFWDPVTQLDSETMRRWMDDPYSHTRRPPLPPTRLVPAAQLLRNPCSAMPEALMEQWNQALIVTPLPDQELQIGLRGSESSESDRGPEAAWQPLQDSNHREAPQENLPMAPLETKSLPPAIFSPIPEEPEEDLEEPAAAAAAEEEEEEEAEAEAEAAEAPVPLPEERDEVVFASLLPPQTTRGKISHIFLLLLKNVSAGKMHVRQDEPYGQIIIVPSGLGATAP